MPPQLSLWPDDDHTPNTTNITDTRPLPLIVAEKWQFPLQYHVVDDVYWFSVNDWIAGVCNASAETASKRWNNIRRDRRTKQTSPIGEVSKLVNSGLIGQYPYRALDNKTYKRDYATQEALNVITQRLNADTPLAEDLRRYLAKAEVLLDTARRDPVAAEKLQNELDAAHSKVRKNSIEGRNGFTDAAAETHITRTPKIGLPTSENYKALFGLAKRQLCVELGLDPEAKDLRDHMNNYALLAITAVETHAAELMRQLGRPLTDDERIAVGRKTAAQFRPVFEAAASEVGQTLTDARLGAPVAKRVKS